MRYETRDGFQFEAEDSHQVVAKLRADTWNPENTFELFARRLAEGAKIQTGKEIPSWPPEALVAGLIDAGLLKKVTE